MKTLEKIINGVILGVLGFALYAFATVGVHEYVKMPSNLAWAVSAGITIATIYCMYALAKGQK